VTAGATSKPITSGGWDMYLYTRAQYHCHFSGRSAVYVEAEGPPSSAAPEAWPILVEALGTSAEVGSDVPIELPGVAPLGVIDYATANFLGLRTSDGLIRFHGRWGLGMAVAVSHHAYRESVDVETTKQAWEEWLAQTFAVVPSPRAASQTSQRPPPLASAQWLTDPPGYGCRRRQYLQDIMATSQPTPRRRTTSFLAQQFSLQSGLMGHLVTRLLARGNAGFNLWVVHELAARCPARTR
jgi:hypothetical protein